MKLKIVVVAVSALLASCGWAGEDPTQLASSTASAPTSAPAPTPAPAPAPTPTPAYALIDIGVGSASGINNKNDVVGNTDTGAFLYMYSSGMVTAIPGLQPAYGVNGADVVVGVFSIPSGPNDGIHARIWESGSYRDLGVAYALGISNNGVVVGDRDSPDAAGSAVMWSSGGIMTDLAPQDSVATAINDQGLIVGEASGHGAVEWVNGTMIDIGTLSPGDSAGAAGVNSLGDIVGTDIRPPEYDSHGNPTPTSGQNRAFLYHNGLMSDLGNLGALQANATGVDDSLEVVGRSTIDTAGDQHAFFWFAGQIHDLNSMVTGDPLAPYVILTAAVGINCNADIASTGVDSRDQQQHAYLLLRQGASRPECL